MISLFLILLALSGTNQTVALTAAAPAARPRPPRLLILGVGNVGRAVWDQAAKSGYFDDRIQGTSRGSSSSGNPDASKTLAFEAGLIGSVLPECTHVLITIPPPAPQRAAAAAREGEGEYVEGDPMFDAVVNELKDKLPRGSWLGFVSTSGVYGNHDGTWVTEESPLYCSEESPTYRYMLHEQKWRELSYRCGWTCRVFRCAGLYGPDRSALHTLWKTRRVNIAPTAGITNRIHETDVARAIVASMMDTTLRQTEFRVYNLSDDEPETRTVVMQYARELLESIGVDTVLVTENADAAPPSARSTRRGTDIKRVSNQRMKQELIGELVFPSYREGLTGVVTNPSSPWCGKC